MAPSENHSILFVRDIFLALLQLRYQILELNVHLMLDLMEVLKFSRTLRDI